MSVNVETVVMAGAALAGAGNAEAQDALQGQDGKTISWEDALSLAGDNLRDDLRAQSQLAGGSVERKLEAYTSNEGGRFGRYAQIRQYLV